MAYNSTHRTIECKFSRICEHFHVLLYIGQLKTSHLKSAYCATLHTKKKIKKSIFFFGKSIRFKLTGSGPRNYWTRQALVDTLYIRRKSLKELYLGMK